MAAKFPQPSPPALWSLVRRQHSVISGAQLLELGYSRSAVRHRVARGRLHALWPDVYAVGRREVTQEGVWMAAVLTCGPGAVVSHGDAAAICGMRHRERGGIEVSVPIPADPRREGISVHRRSALRPEDFGTVRNIPVTSPACTVVDLAVRLGNDDLEQLINNGDKRDLFDPEELRARLDDYRGRPGVGRARRVLDRRTFTMTDTRLEQHFLPIARSAGLPKPLTQVYVNGFRVDFYWPDLRLLVETDGLRYHRTPAQQARDRLRDQIHTAAGLVPLRFTRAQVAFEKPHVLRVLIAVRQRLARTIA